jgi:hypothetical protein
MNTPKQGAGIQISSNIQSAVTDVKYGLLNSKLIFMKNVLIIDDEQDFCQLVKGPPGEKTNVAELCALFE